MAAVAPAAGRLRFTLADKQLKTFRMGLQSLHKIGAELMIEAHPSRLFLRVISSSQSSYMSLSLAANFFEEYDVFDCAVAQAVALFKHALAVFRTQRIARLEFELRVAEGRIEITLHCDNGLVKRYAFTTVEGDVLQATADRGALAVRVVAETDAMARLLDTFHSSLSEVTITAGAESAPSAGGAGGGSGSGPAPGRAVQLRSYVDPARGGGDGALHTLLSLDASVAFVSYAHTGEGLVEATFNVRDFRAMLALCAGLDCPVAISFQGPGSPLVAEPELGADGDLEAELIVATLVTEGEAPQQAAAPQPAPAAAPAAPPPRQDWAQLAAPGAPPGAAPDSRERGELLRTEAARLQAAYARGGGGGGGGRPGSDPLDAAIPSTPPEEQPAAGPSALPGSAAQPGVIATAMDK